MKKIFSLLFIFVFSIALTSCSLNDEVDESKTKELEVNINEFKLSEEKESLCFKLTFDKEETLTVNITEINVLYNFKELSKSGLVNNHKDISLFSGENFTGYEELETQIIEIPFESANYKKDISLMVQVVFDDEEKVYSNLVNDNILDMVKKVYKTNSIASNIYYSLFVDEISLELVLDDESKEGETDKYSYTYSNEDFKIAVKVSLKNDLAFSEDFKFNFNGELIEKSKYSIKGNVLTYKFDDPDKYVDEIELEIDLLKNSDEGETKYYSYTYSNPDYDIITVVITLKSGLEFSDDFELTFNGKVIDSSKYSIKGNKLTYKFNDPNWTGIF